MDFYFKTSARPFPSSEITWSRGRGIVSPKRVCGGGGGVSNRPGAWSPGKLGSAKRYQIPCSLDTFCGKLKATDLVYFLP